MHPQRGMQFQTGFARRQQANSSKDTFRGHMMCKGSQAGSSLAGGCAPTAVATGRACAVGAASASAATKAVATPNLVMVSLS